jgi:hypothetical protein
MTVKLDHILDEARTALSATDQDRLADVIAAYMATRADDPNELLGDAQRAELARRHKSPFEPADPGEVAAFFAKHDA